MKHKLLLLYAWFVRSLLFFLPDMPVTMRFRGWLYGLGMKQHGRDIQITHDANIKTLDHMSLGSHIFIGNGTIFLGSGEIVIEDEVLIGPHCIIVSGNHTFGQSSYFYGKGVSGTIKICRGSWIAGNCTITKDSLLPARSILAAGSVLTKTFTEEDCIYGGLPAKLIKHINSQE